jgi:hypothetical protein
MVRSRYFKVSTQGELRSTSLWYTLRCMYVVESVQERYALMCHQEICTACAYTHQSRRSIALFP